MHHRHRILDRDRLRSVGLHIDFGAPKARQYEGLPGDEQMRAVELGSNVNGEVKAAHRFKGGLRIRHCDSKVAAEADQRLRAPILDCLDGFDCVVALPAWRLETEHAGNAVQQSVIWNFRDPDGSISLYVGMAAQRRDAGALASNVAAKHEKVSDLLHVGGAVAVLGDAHAIVDNDALCLGVDTS